MKCQQKLFHAVAGLLICNLLFAGLYFGIINLGAQSQPPKNEISYEEAIERLNSKNIREISISNNEAIFTNLEKENFAFHVSEEQVEKILESSADKSVTIKFIPAASASASNPLFYLFQILFWLFFISPPIIVILLILIWRELKERNRMK